MKSLKKWLVTESKECLGSFLMTCLKGVKTPKETISQYLENFDIKDLKDISDYINEKDSSNFMAYRPSDDEFVKEANKSQVIEKISQYLYKYITLA